MIQLGDPAPHFDCPSSVNPRFCFDTVAGRYVVISFFCSTRIPAAERFLAAIVENGHRFDVANAIFFGVTIDPEDVARIEHQDNGRIYFYDLELKVSKLFGVASPTRVAVGVGDGHPPNVANGDWTITPATFVLDPALRVVARIHIGQDTDAQIRQLFEVLDSLPPPRAVQMPTPIIVVPYVFEPELCRRLIDYYETNGGEDSGFMREENGMTVGVLDYAHKRRMDCEIRDRELIRTLHDRLRRRVVPAIKQAFAFNVTRIERNIVACYDAAQGAHFRAHRDNTTMGTAHRRFAVTLNLNSPDYEGGEICFPEFGPARYKGPTGSAIIFSCSLLHEVPKVTRGKRYAYLPFLYDDAAAAIREKNRRYLGALSGAVGGTQAGATQCSAVGSAPLQPARAAASASPLLDGQPGCGNAQGCETCLTSPTYELQTPGNRPDSIDAAARGD